MHIHLLPHLRVLPDLQLLVGSIHPFPYFLYIWLVDKLQILSPGLNANICWVYASKRRENFIIRANNLGQVFGI